MAKAIQFRTTGGPEVLKWGDVDVGKPGRGEARVGEAGSGGGCGGEGGARGAGAARSALSGSATAGLAGVARRGGPEAPPTTVLGFEFSSTYNVTPLGTRGEAPLPEWARPARGQAARAGVRRSARRPRRTRRGWSSSRRIW